MADVTTGYLRGSGGYYSKTDGSGPYSIDASGVAVLAGGGAPAISASATLSSLASGTSSASALAANTARIGVIMVNTDAYPVYIKYGATATASIGGFTYQIPSGGTWEMPKPIYRGAINAIWSGDGSGGLSITELT